MARRKNTLPIFRFHPSTGRYYYWDSTARKRVSLGRDRERAEKIFRGVINRITQPGQVRTSAPLTPASELTVAELCLDFRRRVVPEYRDPRARSRFHRAILLLAEFAPDDLADRFTPQRLKDFRRFLLDYRSGARHASGRPLSRKTINYYVSVVKHLYRWASDEDLVRAETAFKIRLLKPLARGSGAPDPRRVPPVPDAVIDATLPHLSPIVAAMIVLQRATGMRPGEVCTMRRGEISTCPSEAVPIPDTSIEARARDGVWLYVPANHKNAHRGKVRVIAINSRAQAVLDGLVHGRKPDAYIFSPAEAARWHLEQNDRSAEHVDRLRACYDHYTYSRAVARAVARANRERLAAGGLLVARVEDGGLLEHWSPGRIRHTTATAVREQFGRTAAAEFLGHAGTDVIDTYAEQAIATAVRIAREMT